MMKNKKSDPTKICFRCGGKVEQYAVLLDLRRNLAVVHCRCSKCEQELHQFRNMTEGERQAEAQRILAEDEARKAEEATKAQREAEERERYEAEKAEIILRSRRGAGRQR